MVKKSNLKNHLLKIALITIPLFAFAIVLAWSNLGDYFGALTFGTSTITGDASTTIDVGAANTLNFQTTNAGSSAFGGDVTITDTADEAALTITSSGATTNGSGISTTTNSLTTGRAVDIILSNNAITSGTGLYIDHMPTAITADYTGNLISGRVGRTLTAAATRTDTGDVMDISRLPTSNNAGGTLNDSGHVLNVSFIGTQTTGTLNWTGSALRALVTGDGVNSAAPIMDLDLAIPGGSTQHRGIYLDYNITSGTQSATAMARAGSLLYTGAASQTGGFLTGATSAAGFDGITWASTGTGQEVIGGEHQVSVSGANGTLTTIYGVVNNFLHQGTGTITTATAGANVMGFLNSSGIITNAKGLHIQSVDTTSGAVDVDNQTGIEIDALSIGDTLNIGLDIENISGATTNYAIRTGTGLIEFGGRVKQKQGADVASATNLTLGTDGNIFEITGTTKIDLISSVNWQNGAEVILMANENVTIDDGTATSGNNITIVLAGDADYAMTALDTLTLRLAETTASGQAWIEVARSVN